MHPGVSQPSETYKPITFELKARWPHGHMVSVLDSGSSGPGSGPGRGHSVVFFSLMVPLSTQVYKWVPAKMLGVTLQWTSIPSRGGRNTPSRFMLQKPEISAGLVGLLGS